MIMISRLIVGVLLLVLGRRLYWLFVAGVGFLAGLELAPGFFPDQSDLVILLVAVVMALIGALLAVLATKVMLAIIGFAAAAGIAIALLRDVGIDSDVVRLAVYVIAGVVGAILMLVLFDWTLIVLSSLAGASLVTLSLGPCCIYRRAPGHCWSSRWPWSASSSRPVSLPADRPCAP